MLSSTFPSLLITIVAFYVSLACAQSNPALVGTWSTKSRSVVTGPGFYDPVADKFIEPALTGISYSFTADGWYEEAYYRAISNPTDPACVSGIIQWQHGKYTLPGNGSIVFEPIAVDGRQLTSSPCIYDQSLYVRYYQPELMTKYAVYTDKFHNVQRLDLYQFDGSPMNPMFLVAQPPQMLPTQTLNPTSGATGAAASSTGKIKRDTEGQRIMGSVRLQPMSHDMNEPDSGAADQWFWAGIALIGIGTAMYMIPTST